MAEMYAVTHIRVPSRLVEQTLDFLKEAGARRRAEGVVLWLGTRGEAGIEVCEAYVPDQVASKDRFRIPAAAMAALLRRLGSTRTLIAAQVHSHPREAFHSHADDEWAIVRHAGAYSIVVPSFARRTTTATFLTESAVFQLTLGNKWDLIPAAGASQHVVIA